MGANQNRGNRTGTEGHAFLKWLWMVLAVIVVSVGVLVTVGYRSDRSGQNTADQVMEESVTDYKGDAEEETLVEQSVRAETEQEENTKPDETTGETPENEMQTEAWKTEKRYKRSEDGTIYLSSLTEYDNGENMTKNVLYDATGECIGEIEYINKYDEAGNLIEYVEFKDGLFLERTECEYDEEGRLLEKRGYYENGGLSWEMPYYYEYDEQGNAISCDYMSLHYDEYGEYTGSGFSNHDYYSYDEDGRMFFFYAYPNVAGCHMYDKTEEEIMRILSDISMDSSNTVCRMIAEMQDDLGEEGAVTVYRFDENDNLLEVDDYYAASSFLKMREKYVYNYDSFGRVLQSHMESDSETVDVVYCYDAE